jgi:hypothetical protein
MIRMRVRHTVKRFANELSVTRIDAVQLTQFTRDLLSAKVVSTYAP